MGSTHYMGLLAANQPWNLMLFMAVPVLLAETIAVTELIVLFSQGAHRRVNLCGMTLLETRIVGDAMTDHHRRKLHAALVGAFLVVAHVAMIFGMLDPTVLGWSPTHLMPGGAVMPGMVH